MIKLNELIKKTKKKYMIEWTTGTDLQIICTLWKHGKLEASGVGTTIKNALINARIAIKAHTDNRTKGNYTPNNEL